jgi:ABC-type uncharacterized transport system ATPase subunit
MTTLDPRTLLHVEHLTMRFGGLTAVGDLSFEARRGDITALIGPNGDRRGHLPYPPGWHTIRAGTDG